VSNWIESGGNAPPLCTDDDQENKDLENLERRGVRRLKMPLTIGFAVLLLGLAA
jgi:hypothetical protein